MKWNETLVPWDFDWSPETCIVDERIHALYSQLPYDTRLDATATAAALDIELPSLEAQLQALKGELCVST